MHKYDREYLLEENSLEVYGTEVVQPACIGALLGFVFWFTGALSTVVAKSSIPFAMATQVGLFFFIGGLVLTLLQGYTVHRIGRLRAVLGTPAGRQWLQLRNMYRNPVGCSSTLKEDQLKPIQESIKAQLPALWLEAHSQAGLVVDLQELSATILREVESARDYTKALANARNSLKGEECETQVINRRS